MKKVFLLSIFLFFALVVNSQNFDKEAVLNYVKNGNVYNCEILQDMGIVQQFPFGTLATDEQLIKYKEGKPRKIKNKLLKGEIKYYVNDVVYSIAIHCNDYQKVKKFLDAKIGKSRTVKYVRFEPYVSWADEYVYDIQEFLIQQAVVYPEKFLQPEEIDKIKLDAYNTGVNIVPYMKVIAILARDRYFSEHNILVEDVDKHDPLNKNKKPE